MCIVEFYITLDYAKIRSIGIQSVLMTCMKIYDIGHEEKGFLNILIDLHTRMST